MDIESIKKHWFMGGQIDGDDVESLIDFAENAEQEILNLKNIIISLRKSNREYNELLDRQDKQIESLQQEVAKKLNTNSRLREENRQIKLEIEKLFDNWALGNYPEALFFAKLQMLIHKLQQS